MYRYEQIIEKACAAVETSCAPCEGFLSKAASNLVPVDNGRLGPFKFSQVRPQYCRRWSGLVWSLWWVVPFAVSIADIKALLKASVLV